MEKKPDSSRHPHSLCVQMLKGMSMTQELLELVGMRIWGKADGRSNALAEPGSEPLGKNISLEENWTEKPAALEVRMGTGQGPLLIKNSIS